MSCGFAVLGGSLRANSVVVHFPMHTAPSASSRVTASHLADHVVMRRTLLEDSWVEAGGAHCSI